MKNRILTVLSLLILSSRIIAQTSEEIYSGTVIKAGYVDDASYGPFNIGFSFTYYGNSYTQFYVNSNGMILFGSGSSTGVEAPIPTAAVPNNFIAAFWDDLVVDATGKILYTTIGAAPNRKLIIQYNNMGFYSLPPYMGSFTVILYETSNVIRVQNRLIVDNTSTRAHGESATIGIENSDGSAGVQYAYHNAAAVTTGKTITFTPSGATYILNQDEIYDAIFLTPNIVLPEPGIPNLLSPPQNSVIGSDYTFMWSGGGNSSTYSLLISDSPDLGGATYYSPGSNTSYNVSGLNLNSTYYWGVFTSNATGTTWCEIKKFTTSSTATLTPVPQTIWTEQLQDKTINLLFTGGDGSPKTAIITALPAQGQLYQAYAGARASRITSVPATVTDGGRNVIYAATGNTGNGVGNFGFKINDAGGDSPVGLITMNVSPQGVPEVLYVAKSTSVEIQFDIPMTDPSGKQSQFTVTVNGTPATISSASLKTGDPNTIVLTLATPLAGTETVSVSYTQGDVTGSTGGILFSFTSQTVTSTAQSITFPVIPPKFTGNAPFNPGATASSGLGITYSSSNQPVATVSGLNVTIVSAGISEITARQAGNGIYAPAKFTRILSIENAVKLNQTITFGTLPVKLTGDADFYLTATSSSGLPVIYSGNNTAVATITGNLVHITGVGSAVITASQPGNTTYNAASNVQQTLSVNNPNQAISFGAIPGKTYGDADFTVTATASSGLTVSFSGDNPSVATVTTAGLIHITGAGSVVITASQDGNGTYNAAEPVSQTFFVSKAPLTFTADNKSKDYLAQIPVLTYSITGFVNGENQSVLDVLPAIQTAALQNSDAGNYPVTISGGNDNSYSYVYVAGTLTINKIRQILTIVDVPSKLMVKDTYTLIVTSNSGLPVHFEVSDVSKATINGNQLTGVARGVIQIRAISAGDQNYFMEDIFFPVEITSTHKDIMHLFTPNSDGYNDYWEIPEMPEWGRCDVKVYGRTGKLVFSMTNYDNQWNGTSDGKPLPEGAYFFIIKTENAGTVTGTVNIVR
jgi:gliding motility-associated-like protein